MNYSIPEKDLKSLGYEFNNRNYITYNKVITDSVHIWLYKKYKRITISQWGGDIDKILNFYIYHRKNKEMFLYDFGEPSIVIRVNPKTGDIIENKREMEKYIDILYSWKFWLWRKARKKLDKIFEVNKIYWHEIRLYEGHMDLLIKEINLLTNNLYSIYEN